MELRHYTEEPFTFEPRVYTQREVGEFMKPVGFWVSVKGEDDWPWWCEEESYCIGALSYEYAVTLRPGANIRYIDSGFQLERFHDEYSEDIFKDSIVLSDRKNYWPVNWGKVVTEYDGLIIAPYLWSHRLSGPSWYYGWDCASGCIWNCEAIESVVEV